MLIVQTVNFLFEAVFWIIILTIFLSFVPNVDWENPIFNLCRRITDAILSPFRNIIPPINGFDFSPIIALVALQLLQVLVVKMLIMLNL